MEKTIYNPSGNQRYTKIFSKLRIRPYSDLSTINHLPSHVISKIDLLFNLDIAENKSSLQDIDEEFSNIKVSIKNIEMSLAKLETSNGEQGHLSISQIKLIDEKMQLLERKINLEGKRRELCSKLSECIPG